MPRSLHVSWAVVALAAMAACTEATRTESVEVPVPDRTAPRVLFASPADGATAVPQNARVSVTFTEPMERATLAGAIGVAGPRGAVIGAAAVSDDARSVTFTPADPLEPGAVHTASLAAGARDLAGNALAPTSWAFVTSAPDRDPPHVVSVSPAPGLLVSVARASVVSATFDEPIDCGALPPEALAVSERGVPLAGTVDCHGATLSFAPFPTAPGNTRLVAALSPLVRDVAGNVLGGGGERWSFDVLPFTVLVGGSALELPLGLAVDGAGHLAVAGLVIGEVIDGSADPGQALVVKLSPGGETEWIRQLGSTGQDLASAVAFDRDGNVLVAGVVATGLGDLATAGGSDAFVVKLDPAGGLLWARLIGTPAPDSAGAVAVDRAGNVLVAGTTSGILDGPGGPGSSHAFAAKLAPDGTTDWIRQLGTSQEVYGRGVAADAAGNVVLAGEVYGTLPGALSAGRSDLFVARFDPRGAPGRIRQLGSSSDDQLRALAMDGAGNLYLAGGTWAALADPLLVSSESTARGLRPLVVVPPPGQEDAFVAKVSGSGFTEWIRQLGSTTTSDVAVAVAVDAAGDVLVAGQLFFGAGTGSGFVARFDFLGRLVWLDRVPGVLLASGGGVALDAAGSAYVAAGAIAELDGIVPDGMDIAVLKYDPAGRRR